MAASTNHGIARGEVNLSPQGLDSPIAENDPLGGTYVTHGRCRVCGATRFINDTTASIIITRPQIIYTCENRMCPGKLTDDPYWSPKSFNIPMRLP